MAARSGAVLPESRTSPIISRKPPQADEAVVTKQERPESSLPVRLESESSYRGDNSRVGGSWTSLREGVIDTEGSVAGESVRPSWYSDVGSEQSLPRYHWNSTLTGSVAPRSPGETNSAVAESERHEWNVETRSVAAESVRPSWIDETASAYGQTDRMDYRDRWMDNVTDIPSLGSRAPVPLNGTKISRAKSSDPQAPSARIRNWREDGLRPSHKSSTRTGTTSTKPSLFGSGKHEKRSDGGRSDSQVSDVGRGKGVAHVGIQVIKRGSTPKSSSTRRSSRSEPPLLKEPEDPTAPTAAKGVQEVRSLTLSLTCIEADFPLRCYTNLYTVPGVESSRVMKHGTKSAISMCSVQCVA